MNTMTQEFATEDEVKHLRIMFSPVAPGKDEVTLKQIEFVYNLMGFGERKCSINPELLHQYLCEIKSMPKIEHQEISDMLKVN